MRTVIGVVAGLVVTVLLAYLGLVIFLFSTVGIPLGAAPEPLTATQYAVLLAVFCGAALAGGRTARRIAPAQRRLAIHTMGAMLAAGAIWGFSGPNQWPDWWGPAVALALVAGATAGVNVGFHRSRVKP